MTSAQGIYISSTTAAFLVTVLMAGISSEVSSSQIAGVILMYTLVGSIFATICGFVFGWPLSLVFKRMGYSRWWQYILGGLACAFPFWFLWFYPFDTGHWEAYRLSNSAYFFSVGALGGLVYWWLIVRPINKSKQQGRPTSWSAPV